MDKLGAYVWIDDCLIESSEATINVFDHGITVGDGVFETISVDARGAFALQRHLDRLRRSAAAIGLVVRWTDDELRQAVVEVLSANTLPSRTGISTTGRYAEAHRIVRMTVTGGDAPLGSARGEGPNRLIVATAPSRAWTESTDVITVDWTRNERGALAGVKTTSYAENVVAVTAAREAGATEAIFANTRGELCEGTGSNIFVEFDGQLATPPLDSGCLAGVTRALVIEALAASNTPVVECAISFDHLGSCAEAFLTSSTRDVQAIASVDGVGLSMVNGPLTTAAATAFASMRASKLDP